MCVVKSGAIIKDNDPRRPDKMVEIIEVKKVGSKIFAIYEAGQRKARVNCDRIFNDGKFRKTGWTLISNPGDL